MHNSVLFPGITSHSPLHSYKRPHFRSKARPIQNCTSLTCHNLLRVPWTATWSNQPWILIGRTNVEAETPILWLPDANSWLIWKDSGAGKGWGQEEKGMTEDEMAGWHHQLDRHGFRWTPGVGDGRRPGVLWVMESQRVGHDWLTELNWTELNWWAYPYPTGTGKVEISTFKQ